MWKAMQNTMAKAALTRMLAGAVAVTVLAVGASGCSGGGGSDNVSPPPSVAATDAFSAEVSKVLATAPDDTEPLDVDAVAETHPEDSEPGEVS